VDAVNGVHVLVSPDLAPAAAAAGSTEAVFTQATGGAADDPPKTPLSLLLPFSRRSTRLVEQESRDLARPAYFHELTHPVHQHDPGLLPSD